MHGFRVLARCASAHYLGLLVRTLSAGRQRIWTRVGAFFFNSSSFSSFCGNSLGRCKEGASSSSRCSWCCRAVHTTSLFFRPRLWLRGRGVSASIAAHLTRPRGCSAHRPSACAQQRAALTPQSAAVTPRRTAPQQILPLLTGMPRGTGRWLAGTGASQRRRRTRPSAAGTRSGIGPSPGPKRARSDATGLRLAWTCASTRRSTSIGTTLGQRGRGKKNRHICRMCLVASRDLSPLLACAAS